MLTIKAFISIAAMQNNDPNVVSALGELSDRGNSFARDKFKYNDQAAPECELIVFESKQITTVAIPDLHVRKSLEISQWIYIQALDAHFGSDVEVFKAKFMAQYGGQLDQFECGEMVTARGVWLPAFIRYRLQGQPDNSVRLWFADQAFQAQYDSYQIIVVPPIKPIDVFMNTTSAVLAALTAFTLPQHQQDINAAAGGVPFTRHKTTEYLWVAPDDPDSTLTTYWSAIVYGGAIVNDDIIRDAIADYILNNSIYNRDQWLPVFPDIFASRGFTIIPAWHKHSTYDATPRGSLYSPVLNRGEDMALANQFAFDRNAVHNDLYLQTTVAQWKSLAIVMVSHLENDGQRLRVTDIYPDYALISTTSQDFNRMAFDTTDWVKKLIKALIMAEEFNEYTILDEEYYLMELNGLRYVMFNHLKVDYLVLTRTSCLEAIGGV